MSGSRWSPSALEQLIEGVTAAARAAASEIMAVYSGRFEVEQKSDLSPLTAADLASHRCLTTMLAPLDTQALVLSEESGPEVFAARRDARWLWLVDPLDGTREFVKRNGEFTVNIALVERGEPVLGVVHAPVRGDLAHAARGQGATLERPGAAPRELATRAGKGEVLRVAGSRSHGDPRMDRFLQRVGAHELLALGSSLKFLLLADGSADVYLRYGPTSEWDTAAGQGVLEAAGGRVTDLALAPLRYNTKDSLLNPDFVAVADPALDLAHLL